MTVHDSPAGDGRIRCPWCAGNLLYCDYHDREWGVPAGDERHLFEMLILEGAQAGLSWLTILKKRQNYRRAFTGFAVEAVAAFGDADRQRLLNDPGIVRNRLKIDAAIGNARVVLAIREEFGSLAEYLWRFVDGRPIVGNWRSLAEIPARTPLSDAMSRDLKRRGCNFVGSTICYALMQATGMVNDHLVDCFRYQETLELPGPCPGSPTAPGSP
jgi:DNA-3-methyladenine glycosylase I